MCLSHTLPLSIHTQVKKVTRLRDKAARAAKVSQREIDRERERERESDKEGQLRPLWRGLPTPSPVSHSTSSRPHQAGPATATTAAPPADAPLPPSHIRAKLVKRLHFFDRVTGTARRKGGGGGVSKPVAAAAAKTAAPPPAARPSASIAALLARPLGTSPLVRGTRLGPSPSALRRAKRKARAGAAVGGALKDLGRHLAAAVEDAVAAAMLHPAPPTPNFSRGRVRMAVGAVETARLTAVVAHPAFCADPVAAIGAHLAASSPPVAAGRARPGAGAGAGAGAGGGDPQRARQQRIRRRREAKAAGRKRGAMALG